MRACGSCTACCTALAVNELNKPTYSTCKHQCGDGCGIYARRPGACRDFQCLWLMGHLGEEDRPDKLGVILSATDHPELGKAIMLTECVDGALDKPVVRQAARRLTGRSPVVLMSKRGGCVIPRQDVPAR